MISTQNIESFYLEFDGKFYDVKNPSSLASLGENWFRTGKTIHLNQKEYRARRDKYRETACLFKAIFESINAENRPLTKNLSSHDAEARSLSLIVQRTDYQMYFFSGVVDLIDRLAAIIHSLFTSVKFVFFVPPPLNPLYLELKLTSPGFEWTKQNDQLIAERGRNTFRLFNLFQFIISPTIANFLLPAQFNHLIFDTTKCFRFMGAKHLGSPYETHARSLWRCSCRVEEALSYYS